MAEINIVNTYDGLSDQQRQEVLFLWEQCNVLHAIADPEKRLKEVVLLAYTAERELAAVFTSYKAVDPMIGELFYYVRTLVKPEFRGGRLTVAMFDQLLEKLAHEFVSGKQTEALGVIAALENSDWRQRYPQAVWSRTPFVFFGEDAAGSPNYVYYFPGATI